LSISEEAVNNPATSFAAYGCVQEGTWDIVNFA